MADEMTMKEWYHEVYLKSDYWKMRRLQIIDARGYKCELCGSSNKLEVHHATYEHLGEERDDELFCLCRNCHEIIHSLIEKRNKNARDEERDKAVAEAVSKVVAPIRDDFIQSDAELIKTAYFEIGDLSGRDRAHKLAVINHACGCIQPKWMRGNWVNVYASSGPGHSYVHQKASQLISRQIKGGNE